MIHVAPLPWPNFDWSHPSTRGDWIHFLRAGDPVWLVKEKIFAIIDRPYMQPLDSSSGDISLIKTLNKGISFTHPKELWMINKDGTGIDGSLLMIPAPGWTFTEQILVEPEQNPVKELTEKEKELCNTIDILEKEIKKLNETKSDPSYSKIIFTEQLKKHGFINDIKQNINESHKAVMATDVTIPSDIEGVLAKLRNSSDHCPGCYHYKEFHDDRGCRSCDCCFSFTKPERL